MNKNFYPTPAPLIKKMVAKIQGRPGNILDPSGGKGDILEYIRDSYEDRIRWSERMAIEIDKDLRATLRGKHFKVIDSDFLTFAGPDKFDLIIANPPFDHGDKHLLKAIDIMYRGEIVFLLNAETIKNPHTNTRKLLAQKLDELNAEVEYIQNAFMIAERKTAVEVALVYINIERDVEGDLFAGADDVAEDPKPEIEVNHEVSTGKTIQELVAEYNQVINIGIETITAYYKNYKKIGVYIGLDEEASKDYSSDNMTGKMQGKVNDLIRSVRTAFWRRTLDLREVQSRLTSSKQKEFEHAIKLRCDMDFTESNIRQFVLNLIGGYEQTLTDAVLSLFDRFTVQHSYSGGLYDKNIHYFSGWKTNNAFKVGKKVIIPIYGGWGSGPFIGYSGEWKLDYGTYEEIRDIDVVMNYFDGCSHYRSIRHAIDSAFESQQSRKILSTYFEITCYKKGTIHLTFRDENILRRFNIAACRGKNWLMHDYGNKKFTDLSADEKEVVESFEEGESGLFGPKTYVKNLNKPVFAEKKEKMMLEEMR